MLILQRKKNEAIRIGEDIRILVTDVGSDSVRLAIEAPAQVKVLREELLEAAAENRRSADVSRRGLEELLQRMSHQGQEETKGEK